MAIQYDILVAAKATNDGSLHFSNCDPVHEDYNGDIPSLKIDFKKGTSPAWYNYVLCGIKGMNWVIPTEKGLFGLKAVIDGNIPIASGLSSSSALVCAAALSFAHANQHSMTKLDLAALCARSEQYIGTQGGGMDQAIAFLGTKGGATHITFNPLAAESVKLPEGAVFVIAQSLHVLNKAKTSDFNCRVTECRLAAQFLAKFRNQSWEKVNTLGELQALLQANLDEMINAVKEALHEEPYTKQEICAALRLGESQLADLSLAHSATEIQEFKLHQRALHVYEEAKRVAEFCGICKSDLPAEEALVALGNIMKRSHESLRILYECSHPMLDKLVELSEGIALGCRLTGAGWGGCVVALTTPKTAEVFIKTLKEKFYHNNPLAAGKDVDKLAFATEPNTGAEIYLNNRPKCSCTGN